MRLIDADELLGMLSKGYETKRALDLLPTIDFWHYPSKGEYPTDGEQVFVAWTSEGSYDVVKFRHCLWGMKLSPPYAWQYIEPPKEEK